MQPFDAAWRLLKDDNDDFLERQMQMHEAEQAAMERAAQATNDRLNSVPCPTCNAQAGQPCVGLNPRLGYPAHIQRMSLAQKGEPMDIAMRLLKEDETPDFSDEPVNQCEMCKKYLDDSDYHVLNDHNYCSDCYNQLAEPEDFDPDFQNVMTGKPMDLAFRMLKGEVLIVSESVAKKLCPAGKAAAKRKFKVYPSAYANGWAVQYCKGKFRGKKKK